MGLFGYVVLFWLNGWLSDGGSAAEGQVLLDRGLLFLPVGGGQGSGGFFPQEILQKLGFCDAGLSLEASGLDPDLSVV